MVRADFFVARFSKMDDSEIRVLLVEDDSRIAHFAVKGLREQAYAVDVAPLKSTFFIQSERSSRWVVP